MLFAHWYIPITSNNTWYFIGPQKTLWTNTGLITGSKMSWGNITMEVLKSENKDTYYNFIYFFLNLSYFQCKQSFILYKTTKSSSTDFFKEISYNKFFVLTKISILKQFFFSFKYGNIKYHSWICINIWYVITHSSEITIKHKEMGNFFSRVTMK